jgi:hypothetical protein
MVAIVEMTIQLSFRQSIASIYAAQRGDEYRRPPLRVSFSLFSVHGEVALQKIARFSVSC